MPFFKQAVVVAVTAFVVAVVIPNYFKPSYPVPEVFGTVSPGFEEVIEVFRQNFEYEWDNREAGSAFSVYHEGEKIIDLWAGYADIEAKRLWKQDTLTIIFSTTKGIAALCIAMLADRGLLGFQKPVAYYWPEFAQKGKEHITIEQLLAHEAGLYVTDEPFTFDLLRNHKSLDKALAEATLKWEPGTKRGYHGLTIGPYIDALVRRIDPKNQTVGQFFYQEVSKPFDIDAYVGLPPQLYHRVGRNVLVSSRWRDIAYAVWNFPFTRNSMIAKIFGSRILKEYTENFGEITQVSQLYNRFIDPDILQIEISSVTGMATARGVAKMFGILANGGKHENKTLLSKGIIDEYVNDNVPPAPDYLLYGHLMRWKYAMDIIPQGENAGNMFGAPGYGGQVGYADPNYNLGYGFVSRYDAPMGLQMNDPRFQRLRESVVKAVKKRKGRH
ncbi:Beta-lactamase domain-containing protein 2 [Holothuria leucospilota]|uniref:Beta-lactamase domain-containing protein 2 n=1 Tax=Holothuria leucospilota TaxID=206669 RepID=A0A9Q1CQC6_HOLLE|nr:Beta-lactamase domain-containing protein 2 [Holothuria leucospilota]